MYWIYKLFISSIFVLLLSCQTTDKNVPFVFDNSSLPIIKLNAKDLKILNKYEPLYSKNYIDGNLKTTPKERFESWVNQNIIFDGKNNSFFIHIYDASILQKEIVDEDAKKYNENKINYYELSFFVEYEMHDANSNIIANTLVETKRSTTSSQFISLYEYEKIIDELIFDSLKDLTKESNALLKIYMKDYLK